MSGSCKESQVLDKVCIKQMIMILAHFINKCIDTSVEILFYSEEINYVCFI